MLLVSVNIRNMFNHNIQLFPPSFSVVGSRDVSGSAQRSKTAPSSSKEMGTARGRWAAAAEPWGARWGGEEGAPCRVIFTHARTMRWHSRTSRRRTSL